MKRKSIPSCHRIGRRTEKKRAHIVSLNVRAIETISEGYNDGGLREQYLILDEHGQLPSGLI
jgi:hypothetical protein